ncbi:hypothetical protein SARC_04980 [Sphaeroforma arctica JP610]|uniref:Nucleolar GTP-binding protein 2 n=1 Tax=Sphaeroforma arctica JP610 TaxID=667725 RepID=A0A0L0G1M3_9EUKA|nr:hypothetical protein SARC_04980 [Sphaeroforma arctica JP610]KNC82739.1 hypothetical protein SARC_04980 [Sphaeroforma arctica JP610]|eukprot:XP_014156641.1 hypothetical protein SARC_04980 [Sphaeroforma arctica JP610]
MYKSGGKAIRDTKGRITTPAPFQSALPSGTQVRVQPDRRWFGNTRVVGPKQLEAFREAMAEKVNDPYQMLLKQSKLPMSLLTETTKQARAHLLDTETFDATFGKKAQRKRPKLATGCLDELVKGVEEKEDNYEVTKDSNVVVDNKGVKEEIMDTIFTKGQSKRIWGELFKVIDSSDIVVQVLDARNPLGTRTKHIEKFLKKEKPHKQLVFILNKCDLVPPAVTQKWVKVLSAEYPTLAFHASVTNPFGKGALIQLLRQFGKFHKEKKQISVGFIGYPNVGKSSIINTLKKQRVCKVAPIPGETKVWQYITLFRKIYLIDCPGVVYPSNDSETDIILKGVVRIEKITNPDDSIQEVLGRVKKDHLKRTYGVDTWEHAEDFLEQMAKKRGRLLPGGEPDLRAVAKNVLHDWQRGRLPHYVPPTEAMVRAAEAAEEARTGKVKSKKKAATDYLSVKQKLEKLQEVEVKSVTGDESESEENGIEKVEVPPKDGAKAIDLNAVDDDAEDVDWDDVFADAVGEEVDVFTTTEATAITDNDVVEGDIMRAKVMALETADEVEAIEEPTTSRKRKLAADEVVVADGANAATKVVDKRKTAKKNKFTVSKTDDEVSAVANKAKRVSTTKKKASNYYSDANVKNKNRNEKKKQGRKGRDRQ